MIGAGGVKIWGDRYMTVTFQKDVNAYGHDGGFQLGMTLSVDVYIGVFNGR